MKLSPNFLVLAVLVMVAGSAMSMPSTTTIRIIGSAAKGRTSAQLVKRVDPVPLGSKASLAASQEWLQTGIAPSLVGTNGQVMYPYGQSRPTITCAPLHICVINLMSGEHISNISIGDSVRWLVQSANAGTRPIVVVKPTQAGLTTNLVVTTDAGRVYYMTLFSDKRDYVPLVGYYDPLKLVTHMQQKATQVQAAAQAQVDARKQAIVAPLGGVDPASLDFKFSCKLEDGDDSDAADLKPVRVFAGGGHTYLQMPEGMKYTDAPAVFNVTGGQTDLMNSRLVHGYFVIDGLPQKFKLIVGAGKNARSVKCKHEPANTGFWSR